MSLVAPNIGYKHHFFPSLTLLRFVYASQSRYPFNAIVLSHSQSSLLFFHGLHWMILSFHRLSCALVTYLAHANFSFLTLSTMSVTSILCPIHSFGVCLSARCLTFFSTCKSFPNAAHPNRVFVSSLRLY